MRHMARHDFIQRREESKSDSGQPAGNQPGDDTVAHAPGGRRRDVAGLGAQSEAGEERHTPTTRCPTARRLAADRDQSVKDQREQHASRADYQSTLQRSWLCSLHDDLTI